MIDRSHTKQKSFKEIHHALQAWYHCHGRKDLPWRNTDDAYRIYLSEIMLQQTQVKTVLNRFYGPFLERFDSLATLAAASEEEVLKAWQGLGYYTRARNLHRTAIITQGQLPSSVDELIALPGIGKNTAHAIASFAFGQLVPVMEANVKRILARFFATNQPKEAQLWDDAYRFLDKNNAFNHNQAMMDIGATICTPTSPNCGACPLISACQGTHDPLAYSTKKAKTITPTREALIIIHRRDDGYVHMSPRTSRFLHGYYHFTQHDYDQSEGSDAALPIPSNATHLGMVKQTYSHFHFKGQVYLSDDYSTLAASNHWHKPENISALPLSGVDEKVLKLLIKAL